MTKQTLMIGQTLWFEGDAMQIGAEAARYHRRGALLIDGGKVVARGDAETLQKSYPQADVRDCGNGLILPGFVDAHMHYPQTRMIASWGKRLIDWLSTYTFPEEMTLADPAEARARADLTLDLALAHGTTTQVSYCTIHPCSVDAFFESAETRGMRVLQAKPAWIAMPPMACATPRKPPTTKAKNCWRSGMEKVGRNTSSRRAFPRPRHRNNWPRWVPCGQSIRNA